MSHTEQDKYGFETQKGGMRDDGIREEDISGLNYSDQGEYRVFHKKCKQCSQEFAVSIPLNFFKVTLPPEMDRDFILRQIKKEYCNNCEQESKNDQ